MSIMPCLDFLGNGISTEYAEWRISMPRLAPADRSQLALSAAAEWIYQRWQGAATPRAGSA